MTPRLYGLPRDNQSAGRTVPIWVPGFLIFVLVLCVSVGTSATPDKEDLVRITNQDELVDFLNTYLETYDYEYDDYYSWGFPELYDAAEMMLIGRPASEEAGVSYSKESAPRPTTTMQSVTGADKGAGEYSTTNIQVAGVDEADFVKNDGKYIYIADDGIVSIIDAYPAETARVVATITTGRTIKEVFVLGDVLVLFSEGYGEEWVTPQGSAAPVLSDEEKTYAELYQIADRTTPDKLTEIQMPGSYEQARMVGDVVYAYTGESVYDPYDAVMPVVRMDDVIAVSPGIWAPPVPKSSYVMHTLTAFAARPDPHPDAESFLIGYDSTLYASPGSIYIAYDHYDPAVVPYYDEMTSKSEPVSATKTVVHRFAINGENVDYKASGTVPGTLLNQFSMDEFASNLRVATTEDTYTGDYYQSNSVFVLTPDLRIIGRLQGLAPDEKIYSARFMGDLLYLVTFKEMDPLFVIDLSDPKMPKVLGKLKIPGYSDYLHPYGDHYLIGIGKDTKTSKWGGVVSAGLKFALFDVSDVTNPVEIDNIIIGESRSGSPVLTDHRAFLLDIGKDIMVLPVCIIRDVYRTKMTAAEIASDDDREDAFIRDEEISDVYKRDDESWSGVLLYGINPEIGFIEKARIPQGNCGSYCYDSCGVLRSLYMNDVLYTISEDSVLMTDLANPGAKINEVMLFNGKYSRMLEE
ncbi:MAG: beta-propeller domain-containing protein [Methanospirillaceae archaeon]|nr:beta-propeller domain-containing protein [Methanospirillaceae archaeon]